MTLEVWAECQELRIRRQLAIPYIAVTLPPPALRAKAEPAHLGLTSWAVRRDLGAGPCSEKPMNTCACGGAKLLNSMRCLACQRGAGWQYPTCACGRIRKSDRRRCHDCIAHGRYIRRQSA